MLRQNDPVLHHDDKPFWKHAEKMDDGRIVCQFCGQVFAKDTSISRIKFHLAGVKGRGVRICGKVPQDVQDAALAAIDGPPEKLKTGAGSSNNEVTNAISASAQQHNNEMTIAHQQNNEISLEDRIASITVEDMDDVDRFWEYAKKMDDGRIGCTFCGHPFANGTSISRIKFHLAGVKGRGVRNCGKVPQDVQDAVLAAIDGPPEKKLKTGAGSSNNEVTNAISASAQQQNNEMTIAHQQNNEISLEDWMASIIVEDMEPLQTGSFHERPSFNKANEPRGDPSQPTNDQLCSPSVNNDVIMNDAQQRETIFTGEYDWDSVLVHLVRTLC